MPASLNQAVAPSVAGARRAAVIGSIERAARAAGVDFTYLLGQARLESGLNPAARARTSSATGLFQFIDQSWLGVIDRHGAAQGLGWAAGAIEQSPSGRYRVADPAVRAQIMALRTDPGVASAMAAAHARDNQAHLEARTGRRAEPVDLYLAHFLGAGGAARFLTAHAQSPDASAAAMFPEAAAANRPVFFDARGAPRSLEAVRARFASRLAEAGGGAVSSAASIPNAPAERFVEPADWLRLTRAVVPVPPVQTPAPGAAATDENAIPDLAAVRPAQARLAYLLLASQGALL